MNVFKVHILLREQIKEMKSIWYWIVILSADINSFEETHRVLSLDQAISILSVAITSINLVIINDVSISGFIGMCMVVWLQRKKKDRSLLFTS